jgi:hypothetical protein
MNYFSPRIARMALIHRAVELPKLVLADGRQAADWFTRSRPSLLRVMTARHSIPVECSVGARPMNPANGAFLIC